MDVKLIEQILDVTLVILLILWAISNYKARKAKDRVIEIQDSIINRQNGIIKMLIGIYNLDQDKKAKREVNNETKN